jgi:microcystin-dependent protein
MARFERPDIPYNNRKLNNSSRYKDLNGAAPPPALLDGETNYVIDSLNDLHTDMAGIEAGVLPGANDINNANGVAITDGQGNVSFSRVGSQNIQDGVILGKNLAAKTITARELSDGCVSADNISDNSITQSELAPLSVGTSELQDGCNTLIKQAANSINESKVIQKSFSDMVMKDKAITQRAMADDSVGLAQLIINSVDFSILVQAVRDAFVPIGTVIEFAGTTGLSGNWLLCNGSAVSRTTYATLFTNIGTTYGAGNGSTTFNLPDRRGVVGVGIGSDNSTGGRITNATASNIALGKTFGAETHTLTEPQMPIHTHNLKTRLGGHTGGINTFHVPVLDPPYDDFNSAATGGDQPHNNMQPSMFVRYYIRAL